jgi:hypothetical protein
MALQYVGGATASKAGSTSGTSTINLTALTGGIASAAAAGDLVIALFVTGSNTDRTLSITDGSTDYTLIASELYSNGSTSDTNLRAAYKFMGVTPDTSVTFGATGNNQDAGAMIVHVWRGVDPTTPLDVAAVTATGTGTARPNPAAITPTTTGAVVIVACGGGSGTSTTFTMSGLSNFLTIAQADSFDATAGMGSFAWTSGSYDPAASTTGNTNAGNSWAAITLALRPAVFDEVAADGVTVSPSVPTATIGQNHQLSIGGGDATASVNVLTTGKSATDITTPFQLTTASITVTAGRPVLIAISAEYVSGFDNPPLSLTISGAGQTWTELAKTQIDAGDPEWGHCHLWTSDAASGGSGALTITFPEGVDDYAYSIIEIEPSAGAEAAIGTADISAGGGTATSISDTISAVGASDYQIAYTGVRADGTTQVTPRSGWTDVSEVIQLEASWSSIVHLQISPQGGDTTASASFDGSPSESRIITVPITVTGGGGDGLTVTTHVADATIAHLEGFTAPEVVISPSVGTASISQNHALAGDAQAVQPTVPAAPISQTHALAGTGLTVDASIGAASISQVHALAGSSVVVQPSVPTAALAQAHALAAGDASISAMVAEAQIAQNHALAGVGADVSGAVGDGTISTSDPITASPVTIYAAVDAASIAQAHGLAAQGVAVQPATDAATITQAHALAATGLASLASVPDASIATGYGLAGAGVSVAPSVEGAQIAQAHALAGAGVTVAGEIGPASIAQNHGLAGVGIVVQPSVPTAPVGVLAHEIAADGVASSLSVEAATIAALSNLAASGLLVQPSVGAAAITQNHGFAASEALVAAFVEQAAMAQVHQFSGVEALVSISVGEAWLDGLPGLPASGFLHDKRNTGKKFRRIMTSRR